VLALLRSESKPVVELSSDVDQVQKAQGGDRRTPLHCLINTQSPANFGEIGLQAVMGNQAV